MTDRRIGGATMGRRELRLACLFIRDGGQSLSRTWARSIASRTWDSITRTSWRSLSHLADQIGGRMTNSPAMRMAEHWTQDRLPGRGVLKDVRADAFDFGRGWWIEASSVRMTAPRPLPLHAIPIAWTPATNGAISAPIIVAPMLSEKDFAEWRGKLAGKIVLVTWPSPGRDDLDPPFQRLSETEDRQARPLPGADLRSGGQREARRALSVPLQARWTSLPGSTRLLWVQMSRVDGDLVHGEGYAHQAGKSPKLPGIRAPGQRGLSAARPPREGGRGEARDRLEGSLRGCRPQRLQHHRRHPGHREQDGLCHGRGATWTAGWRPTAPPTMAQASPS